MQVDLGALVEGSSGGVLLARLAAYARPADARSPYCVVNDYVATAVGLALGAPVPPGVLTRLGAEWGYLSLGFGEQGKRPPPADFEELAVDRPWEATGIVVLDQWISNTDRHDGNLAYMPTLGVAAFDHDQALFGACPPGGGVESLKEARERRVRHHELIPHMNTMEHFPSWIDRAQSITHAELSRMAWVCVDAGLLSRLEADALVDFLEYRQLNVGRFIEESYPEFTGVAAWTLDSDGGE
ncbi:hypothetical protein CAG99_12345 [Streptomyces marincola]|uniref:HipA-like C-terminal domain-containing protein n=1 Tax=Streptomyces marincola TaxID=2878388 RepID=A0A1W7CZ15_9ACTN|nr:hypothetical protein CAG99_12345 [Streptomyces marincola]